jgi:hypothetical protein
MKDLYGIVGDRVHGEGQRQKQFPPLRYGMTNKEMSATAEADSFAALRNDNQRGKRNSRFLSGMTTRKATATTKRNRGKRGGQKGRGQKAEGKK